MSRMCQSCFKIENEPGVYKYVKSVSKFCHYKIKNEAGMYKQAESMLKACHYKTENKDGVYKYVESVSKFCCLLLILVTLAHEHSLEMLHRVCTVLQKSNQTEHRRTRIKQLVTGV